MSQYSFEKTYGGTEDDMGWSAQQTSDGGFIVAGHTESFGAGDGDFYLLKISPEGDTLWTKSYGGISHDHAFSMQQTSDGGYIISGATTSFGLDKSDVYLIKTNSFGDTLWTKTYGGDSTDTGWDVQQTSDGGYIISGWTFSFTSSSQSDLYLVKTDSLGDTLWTKAYGDDIGSEGGWSVKQTSEGGYIIGGFNSSYGAGWDDVWLVKTDSLGDTLWTRTYGGSSMDFGFSVHQNSDGGYTIAGWTWSFGAGHMDVYLIRTNASGDSLWTRTCGGTGEDRGFTSDKTSDGGYIIAGKTKSFGTGESDVYLVKTNSLGDTLWTRTFGGSGTDMSYSVKQTSDGGFLITGRTESFGAGGNDVYLIKTCPDGTVGGRCKKNCLTFNDLDQTIADAMIDNEGVRNSLQVKANNARKQYEKGKLKTSGNILCAILHETDAQDGKHITPESAQDIRDCVKSLAENHGIPLPCEDKKRVASPLIGSFPNPFRRSTMIEYRVYSTEEYHESLSLKSKNNQNVTLRIFDLMGREVKTLVEDFQEPGIYFLDWDGKNFRGEEVPSGVYFYRLKVGETSSTKKMILLH
jgi:hypothetical protein